MILPTDVEIPLKRGTVIPAMPLALTKERKLDERRQRALVRYYSAAGAGGLAVGVHTTQFQIRDPNIGLFEPVLSLAAEELNAADAARQSMGSSESIIRIAGVCGRTHQAVTEAKLARSLGYHMGLLSLAAMKDASEDELIDHCQTVADIIPIVGFYLQPAVGGRALGYAFWRRFAEIQRVAAIKMAPFNRYQTIDVIRAVAESGREDIALYTGNDDNIVMDLLTPYKFRVHGEIVERRIVGGLLGHWCVWTKKAVEMLDEVHSLVERGDDIPADMLSRNIEVTDANAAFFDAANSFAGCIAGVHEVLRRQRLFANTLCLDPNEALSPGQQEEIDRVYNTYPHLNDDKFVEEHLEEWLQ